MKITIDINENDLLELIMNRVRRWETGRVNEDLYESMYENAIYNDVFSYGEFNLAKIVDNDIVNYTTIIKKGDDDFDKLLSLYKDGVYDVSKEDFKYYTSLSYIEAVSKKEDKILVRY